jgi:hypothetical protein
MLARRFKSEAIMMVNRLVVIVPVNFGYAILQLPPDELHGSQDGNNLREISLLLLD